MSEDVATIDYHAVLADLEEKRARLDAAIAAIKMIASGVAGAAPEGSPNGTATTGRISPTSIPEDAFFGMSGADAVAKLLGIMKKPQSTPQICEALKAGGYTTASRNFTTTVHTAIKRQEPERFVRVGKTWGLAEWYPGARKAAKGKAAGATTAADLIGDDEDEEDSPL
ncbi:MAG TPA: hypothetical protein VEL28_04525 [Candidatus Binatia bacterium]|nr:hypothetical protein [Candidatus Binatia bacterium]